MIEQTFKFIKDKLLEDVDLGFGVTEIIADNMHVLSTGSPDEGLYYSLINIEEEPTLKNRPNYDKVNGQLRRIEPPIILNLYILFALNLDNYNTCIMKLSQLIGFFQTNKWFNLGSNAETDFSPPLDKIVFELYNMNFEQINHIWSVLGGNHYPSVVYKVRVVKVQRDVQYDASEVTEIELKSGVSN